MIRSVVKGHYAICIGSEMSGGVHQYYAINNRAQEEVSKGVYIKGGRNRGGKVSDIYVDRLEFDKVKGEVVKMVANYDGDTKSPYPSRFENIHFSNIAAKRQVVVY